MARQVLIPPNPQPFSRFGSAVGVRRDDIVVSTLNRTLLYFYW
jgi:hypothetical protein